MTKSVLMARNGDEKCAQNFDQKTQNNGTALKTQAKIGG